MRIGNWLGGSVLVAWLAMVGVQATAGEPERPISVPLGNPLAGQSGDRHYGVYIPTRFGGRLTVKTTEGTIADFKGPRGTPWRNGEEIGVDQQGWYLFKIEGSKNPYTVEASFVQLGESLKRPWNFYYWPTKADSIHEPWAGGNGRVDTMERKGDDVMVATPGGYIPPGQDIVLAGPNGLLETLPATGDDATWFPNLFDDLFWLGPDKEHNNQITRFQTQAPLLKYDQIFGTQARQWEAAFSQNREITRWPGHCLGGAVASITFNEPQPAAWTGMTKDELKALYAELGENHYNHRIGDYATEIPPGPPRMGLDPCDQRVARVHAMLETHIRGEHKALLGNLRAFPPRGTINEVWNHGIYKYIATYQSVPGRGQRAVRLKVELHANSGSMLNGQDNQDRVVNYEYILVYGLDGRVDETNTSADDWISVGGEALFAPLNLLEVLDSRWSGHNPHVTEANVRSLDMANGGGERRLRFAGSPPIFRSVAQYEAGRAPMVAEGEERPRRGFFRTIFGR